MVGIPGRCRTAAPSIAALAAATILVQGSANDEAALLRQIGFSAQEVQQIARGETVGRTTSADASAVALAVAGTIAVPIEFYLEKFRDIESFKKSPEVHQIGRFGREPSPADAASLTVESADVNDLEHCRVGDCGVKLDAGGIEKLAARDARIDTASAGLRQHLAAYAQRYLQTGNGALMEYRDTSRPIRIEEGLRAITDRLPYLREGWPALFDAVAQFPGSLPPGLEGFLYWSKEKIGPRAVVSVTHVIISPPRGGRAAVATKQIFASHYSNASLGLTILIDRGTTESPRTRVIYVNRSRLDIFGGLFGTIKRPLVRSRAREGAERTMRGLRERLERQYRGGVHAGSN